MLYWVQARIEGYTVHFIHEYFFISTMRGIVNLQALSFIAVISLIAILAWLTLSEEDPCANPQSDISASVLAEGEADQDGLINRAIIMKANCKKP